MLIFQLAGSVLGYDYEDCQDHQFLLLKQQDVMQTTKYSLKNKQIYEESINLKISGPSKSAPPSDVSQHTIKLK